MFNNIPANNSDFFLFEIVCHNLFSVNIIKFFDIKFKIINQFNEAENASVVYSTI